MRFLTHSVIMPTGVARPTENSEATRISALTEPVISLRSGDNVIFASVRVASTLDVVDNQKGFKGLVAARALAPVSGQSFFPNLARRFTHSGLKLTGIGFLHSLNVSFACIKTFYTKHLSFFGFSSSFTYWTQTYSFKKFVIKFFSYFLFHKYSVSAKIL